MPPAADPYWNHNTRYFDWVLGSVPGSCKVAVDIGCGDGLLLGLLAARSRSVVGVEASAAMDEQARRAVRSVPAATVVHTDFLKWPVADSSVDFFSAVASLHHMDLRAALSKIAHALRPGGAVAIVGLARDAGPLELLLGAASLPMVKLLDWRHGVGGPAAPVRDPELSWAETAALCRELLPGVVFRRRVAWRYTAYWRRPG